MPVQILLGHKLKSFRDTDKEKCAGKTQRILGAIACYVPSFCEISSLRGS